MGVHLGDYRLWVCGLEGNEALQQDKNMRKKFKVPANNVEWRGFGDLRIWRFEDLAI